MPRTYGNRGPVVTATRGIELPRSGAPRLDIDAIRARATSQAARAAVLVDVDQVQHVYQVQHVDQVRELDGDQAPVRLVDQAATAVPVVRDVCSVLAAARYVARTGQTRHKPCQVRAAGPAVVREGA